MKNLSISAKQWMNNACYSGMSCSAPWVCTKGILWIRWGCCWGWAGLQPLAQGSSSSWLLSIPASPSEWAIRGSFQYWKGWERTSGCDCSIEGLEFCLGAAFWDQTETGLEGPVQPNYPPGFWRQNLPPLILKPWSLWIRGEAGSELELTSRKHSEWGVFFSR